MLSMHAAFKQTRGSTLCVPQCAQTCFWQWQGTGNDLSQCPQHSSSSCSFWTSSLQLQPHPSPCHQPCPLPLGLQLLPAQQVCNAKQAKFKSKSHKPAAGFCNILLHWRLLSPTHSQYGCSKGCTLPVVLISGGFHMIIAVMTLTST